MVIASEKYCVSILIAFYNRKEKLLCALDSVFKQTFSDYEIILIDDGSEDNFELLVSNLLRNHPNLKYLKHSNRGTALSLNSGINISSGRYITFLDSDDLYEINHIELRVNYLKDNNNVDLIHTTAKIIGDENNMYVPDATNPGKLIHLSECVLGATIFGKREVFESLHGFINTYAYDYDFIERAKLKYNVERLDIPTYIYNRNSSDSILTQKKYLNFPEK